MATTGYQAGVESNDVVLSYAKETVWGVAPATTFQQLRYLSEGFTVSKSRDRPAEVNNTRQVSAAITKQQSSNGSANFALSYGTYDDILAGCLMSDWGADLNIAGVSGDIVFVAAGNQITSTTSGKFTAVQLGQWIRTLGSSIAGNNGYSKVIAKPDNQTLTVSGLTLANDTPAGTAAKIRGSMIRNSNVFQSFFFQKFLATNEYLTYPGAYPSDGSLDVKQGQFAQGTFNFLNQNELKATTDSSTGGVLPPTTTRVMDTVTNTQKILVNNAVIAAVVQGISLKFQKQGAAQQFGVGSAAAQGIVAGTLELSGTLDIFFKTFALYDLFAAETQVPVSFQQTDFSGNTYMFTVLAGTLMNPSIKSEGRDKSVMASFTIEGNPDPTLSQTVQVDRFAGP